MNPNISVILPFYNEKNSAEKTLNLLFQQTITANEKPFKISLPKKNIDNNANKVVIEVIKVLDKVSFIEIFVKS